MVSREAAQTGYSRRRDGRTQPVMTSQRQTNGCHHGNDGRNCDGHPLELYPDIAWDTYCPVARMAEHVGEIIVACGLVVEQRTHHRITGEPMKFLTLADWTGIVETELFAQTYRDYGLATVRYPVLEVEAKVEAFENGRGFTLRVLRAGKPRSKAGSF